MRGMAEKISSRTRIMLAVIAAQWTVGILLVVLPFGFDHPSSLGLDWDDFKFGMKVFAGLSLLALVMPIWCGERVGLIPAALPVIVAGPFWLVLT